MSLYAADRTGYLQDVASIAGWRDFTSWAHSVGGILDAFVSDGVTEDPAALAAALYELTAPVPSVETTRQGLFEAALAASDVLIVTDGVSSGLLRTAGGEGSGNFGHAGRPGEVGGSAPSVEELQTRVKNLTGQANVIIPPGNGPAAAHIMVNTLEEMHAKGYSMPEYAAVHVFPAEQHVFGETRSERGEGRQDRASLRVILPAALPLNADLDKAAQIAFGSNPDRTFSIKSFKDIVVHEMGHVQTAHERGMGQSWPFFHPGPEDKLTLIAKSVSDYATESPDEFIAEAFTRLYRGDILTKDAVKLYERMGGPKIR